MRKIVDNNKRAQIMSPNKMQRIVKCCNKIKKHLNDIKNEYESEFVKSSIDSCEIWCNLIIFEVEGK